PPPLPRRGAQTQRETDRSGGDELAALRTYQTGDPPRNIAWKASARRDLLFRVRADERAAGFAAEQVAVVKYDQYREQQYQRQLDPCRKVRAAMPALQPAQSEQDEHRRRNEPRQTQQMRQHGDEHGGCGKAKLQLGQRR
ncbi:MAG: DUF58 domain-containing protein, partial [Xanthomonadaceae bacterium]|nr:DUF58 domain-containing protein [Xanthomonadaceae bacterium]